MSHGPQPKNLLPYKSQYGANRVANNLAKRSGNKVKPEQAIGLLTICTYLHNHTLFFSRLLNSNQVIIQLVRNLNVTL